MSFYYSELFFRIFFFVLRVVWLSLFCFICSSYFGVCLRGELAIVQNTMSHKTIYVPLTDCLCNCWHFFCFCFSLDFYNSFFFPFHLIYIFVFCDQSTRNRFWTQTINGNTFKLLFILDFGFETLSLWIVCAIHYRFDFLSILHFLALSNFRINPIKYWLNLQWLQIDGFVWSKVKSMKIFWWVC